MIIRISNEDPSNQERSARGPIDEDKSVVDVFIRYPATSVVDVDAIKQKLVSNPIGSDISGRNGRMEAEKTKISEDYTLIKILAAILTALLVLVIIFIVCCCCPSKIRLLLIG